MGVDLRNYHFAPGLPPGRVAPKLVKFASRMPSCQYPAFQKGTPAFSSGYQVVGSPALYTYIYKYVHLCICINTFIHTYVINKKYGYIYIYINIYIYIYI